jgi:hypothetical protein
MTLPTQDLITTDRFGLELPDRPDRVRVQVLTAAFRRLDADAANLRIENTFLADQAVDGALTVRDLTVAGGAGIGGQLTVGESASVGLDLTVSRNAGISGDLQVGGAISAGSLNTPWLTVGYDLTVGRNASIAGNATAHLFVPTSNVVAIDPSTAVRFTWDGGSIQASHQVAAPSLWSHGNVQATGAVIAAAHVAGSRLIVANWDLGTAVSIGGDLVTSGMQYQRGSLAYRCWDNADFLFNVANAGSQLVQRDVLGNVNVTDVAAAGRVHAAGQVTAYGGSPGNNNAFVAPNDGSERGEGLAREWRTFSSVDHALEYGLNVEAVDDPLGKVLAIRGVHYDHISFGPDPATPRRTKDGALVTTPTYGFSASEVAAVLPEIARDDGPDGQPLSLDLDRMLVILWEAFKVLEDRTTTLERNATP